ncbi:MAG: hypothetical protein JWO31_618 [Phycisphaerales bacterium]|nr:hypothetical protein [Phycisphaerales bacterium]
MAAGTHAYTDAGNHTVHVAFRRRGRVLGRVRDVVVVLPASPGGLALSAVAGEPFEATLGTFTRRGFSPYTPLIDWGDGTQSLAMLDELDDTTYQTSGSHTYSDLGTYPVSVSVFYVWRPTPEGQPDLGLPAETIVEVQSMVTVRLR